MGVSFLNNRLSKTLNSRVNLIKHFLFFVFIHFFTEAAAQLAAFPDGQGFGVYTPGGRGGEIIKVNNLNDNGPGSLRAAVEKEGPRIVIFELGGIINLHSKLIIKEPFITIAGQSAPGDGICIRGEGLSINTHDVILRFIRVRPGNVDFGPENDWESLDALSIGANKEYKGEVYNILVDHCSFSWSTDEVIGIGGDAHDITIQYCIISEALNGKAHPKGYHSMGMLIGNKASNISVHHNLFAHNDWRNPLVNGESFLDFRNNICYNPGSNASAIAYGSGVRFQKINYVGNYFIRGSNTKARSALIVRGPSKDIAKIYIEGNIGPNVKIGDENWEMVKGDFYNKNISMSQRVINEFPHPETKTHNAYDAYKIVLKQAGAILPRRDPVDKKIVEDVANEDGSIIDTKDHLLQWPPYRSGLSPLDTDNDGLPDHWESFHGKMIEPNLDADFDGYSNIEEYLNGTDPFSLNNKVNRMENYFIGDKDMTLALELLQNYPNPSSGKTKIKFSIPAPSQTSLKIWSLDGKVVESLIEEYLYEGIYEITWNTSSLVPGKYLIILHSNSHHNSKIAIIEK